MIHIILNFSLQHRFSNRLKYFFCIVFMPFLPYISRETLEIGNKYLLNKPEYFL